MAIDDLLNEEASIRDLLTRVSPKTLGSRIRRARQVQGLSLRKLASMAAISLTTMMRIEQGEEARPMTILKIFRALGLHQETMDLPEPENGAALHRRYEDRWYDALAPGAGPLGGKDRPLKKSERAQLAEKLDIATPLLMLRNRLPEGKIVPSILELRRKTAPTTHHGEEMVFVLRGLAAIYVNGKKHILGAGEAITFRGLDPHGYGPATSDPALVLSVQVNP